MDLNEELLGLARNQGVSHFGVADLSLAKEALIEQGGPELNEYPFSISLGIRLFDPIVDRLPFSENYSDLLNYKHHCYDIINQRLDLSASILATYIQDKGYKVLPLPAAERIDDIRICASFSHKLGARLAGLGWIGKSCLLITPENGPRVRWVSILTDAPLQPTGSPMEQQCGNCTACVDICPVDAFTGITFKEEDPREVRYDARKCENYFKAMKNQEQIQVCGLCVYVCPHGNKQ